MEKAKGVREFLGAKALPVPKKEDKPKANKPPKVNNENAAPVPGKPNPKAHSETMKGKGKDGQGKERGKRENRRGRSPSQDRKSFIRVDALRVKIVLSVIQRRKPLVVPVLSPGMGKEVILGMTELHHPNLKVRNQVSYMQKGSAIERTVLTDTTTMQRPLKLDQRRQRLLPKEKPKPKAQQWW